MASGPSTSIRRLSQAELARELGVSRQAISKHVAAGTIPMDAHGKIDVELAKRALADRVRPSGKTAAAIVNPPPAVTTSIAAQPAAPADDADVSDTSFHVARTLREAEEARMAKLKRLKMERKLIDKDATITAVFTAFRGLRDAAMPLGRRVAARVATMTDPREIQLLVDEAMREVLKTFADRTLTGLTGQLAGAPVPLPADQATDAAPAQTA